MGIHVFSLLACHILSAQELDTLSSSVKRTYSAQSLGVNPPPEIDGHIDDPSWDLATWGRDFVEWRPDENTPPSQQTQFRVLYDQKYLYVAIRCFDSVPSRIEKRLSRRDTFSGDRVAIILDTYGDKRNAFAFSVTAAGVKGDEYVSENGGNFDDSWNPIWYTAAKTDSLGWTAEMKIPFSQLKFGNAPEQQWGFQCSRMVFRENEWSVWQRVPRDAAGMISEFGMIRGLFDIQPQKQLEIQPFVVAQGDTYPAEAGNPFRDGSDLRLNGGLDAKIGITNDLTLDLTVNPDFGQVDADPGAIALDGFQIFFQERRPFFVENKNIFDFRFANGNDNLFYSRRIGRDPQGELQLGEGEFADIPNNTVILGAAKFSGKTRNGWSVGILESVTSRMNAEVNRSGVRGEEVVEPLTNYLVGRVQKDFNDRKSYLGGIFTATNRNLQDDFNYLRQAAYTAGIDFRHTWKDRNYYLEGNTIASHVKGSPEAMIRTQQSITHLFQREDAGHVSVDSTRTSLSGTGGKFEIGKEGGGNWRYRAGGIWRSPGLELNDVGFLRQADEIIQFSGIERLFLKPSSWYRNMRFELSQFTTYDFEGNYNRIQYEYEGFISFANNWWMDTGAAHKPRIFSNTTLQGGPRWRFSEENFAYLFFGSDRSKKFYFTLGHVNSSARENNFAFRRYVVRLDYQPLDALSLSLDTAFSDNPNRTQYVTETDFNGTPRYIMAAIDQKTLSSSFRFNYSLNPNLSIQYYGQPFISRGVYSDYNFVNNPLSESLAERVSWYDDDQIEAVGEQYVVDEDGDGESDYSFDKPDFAFVQFRSNLVLRWEYIPGSEIFLVWSQGVDGFGEPMESLGRSLDRQILHQQPNNTFLIKATYRFVL